MRIHAVRIQRSPRLRRPNVVVALAIVAYAITMVTTLPPLAAFTSDPTNSIAIDTTNTAGGVPPGDDTTAQPGDSYTYNITASCSDIVTDCVNLTVVDTFPAGVIIDKTLPSSIPGLREVTWNGSTLTVKYVQPLGGPPGAFGKPAGTSDPFTVHVTLPADTPLEDGAVIANEATISASNVAESATDASNVEVNIPRVVAVATTKSFSSPSAVAGDLGAGPAIQIGAENRSSSSARVTAMRLEDATPGTFEYLDFVTATVTGYPAGADQAQLFVCPSANAPCDSDDDYVPGGIGTPPAPTSLTLPGGISAADVVGVRVVFTDTNGSFIARVTQGGTATVAVATNLRGTIRSTGQPITAIPATITIVNSAKGTVTDPGASPASATGTADAQFRILPPPPPSPPSPPSTGPMPPPAGTSSVKVVTRWEGKPGTATVFVDRDGKAPYDASARANAKGGVATASFPLSTSVTVGETRVPSGYRAVINCGAGWRTYRGGPFRVVAPADSGTVRTCTIINRGQPRLVLTKRPTKRTVGAGETVDIHITVQNRGRGDARNVRVCDRLPKHFVFVRAGGAQFRKGDACWTFRRLQPGAVRHVVVRTKTVMGTRRVGVRNIACISRPTNARSMVCTARATISV